MGVCAVRFRTRTLHEETFYGELGMTFWELARHQMAYAMGVVRSRTGRIALTVTVIGCLTWATSAGFACGIGATPLQASVIGLLASSVMMMFSTALYVMERRVTDNR